MDIVKIRLDELTPYSKNAKKHPKEQIDQICESIEQFGNCDPIAVWGENNVIVEGHGRFEALKKLGYHEAECIRLDYLTDEERRAYTLAHNKLTMNSGFDFDLLTEELDEIFDLDMSDFGFNPKIDFNKQDGMSEKTDEYNEFVEKFEVKKTTDDCYTPQNIYDAVLGYVCDRWGIDPKKAVRPFYPGGDYENFNYSEDSVVVDNPPFSILSKIMEFYVGRGIKFFMFAPSLTAFSGKKTVMEVDHIICDAGLTYENGAVVRTAFVTNLEPGVVAESDFELSRILKEENDKNTKSTRELGNYEYPDNVITAAKLQWFAAHGTAFKIMREDCMPIAKIDANPKGIFGGGLLLSERAAAERAAAERAAAERAAAERAAAERAAAERFELSEREWELVRSLG